MRSPIRLLAGTLAVFLILVALYGVAAGVGSTIPVNADRTAPASGVTVWIEDNGIHTTIVMPKRAGGVDWTDVFPARDLGEPRYAGWGHVAVSWGERDFFVGTPTWWDLKPTTVLRAMVGSDATVLHVEHVAPPVAGEAVRAVVLRPSEYRRLAAFVRASMGVGPAVRGYAGYDAFYPARGRYDAVRTCNWWTGQALRVAGVTMGVWTPTSAGVMRWTDPAPSR